MIEVKESVVIDTNSSISAKKLNEYASITKEYPKIILKGSTTYKKKIKYNNPDDVDKIIKLTTSDPIVKIKTEQFAIEYKSSKFLRFSFEMPATEGKYRPSIIITDMKTGEVEEVLKFFIEVVNNVEKV
jgi:hypothetical protein